MDGRVFLPTIAWSFKVRNVIFLTPATIENPATFRCTAIPFDSSDPGANQEAKEIGCFVTDNVGNIYTVIGLGTHTVDLSDDFRCGVGPQTGKWAVLSKSVGNGEAPFLTPIHYRRLDKSAIDNIRRIELDILWKHRLFTYTAYASDDIGTDFTLVNDTDLLYMAVLVSPVEILTPVVGDFVGLWRSGGSGSFPATIDSTTTNVDNGTTHTHELGDIDHNSFAGLNTGDYQHLTAAELEKVQALTIPLEITGITLLSASWTLVSGLYEYDLANVNITANHVVDVIPENADIAILKAAEILPKTVSSAGSVKLYATNTPSANIGVTIILTTATT